MIPLIQPQAKFIARDRVNKINGLNFYTRNEYIGGILNKSLLGCISDKLRYRLVQIERVWLRNMTQLEAKHLLILFMI